MTLQEVLKYFIKKYPNNEPSKVYQPDSNTLLIIAPDKKAPLKAVTSSPNMFIMNANGDINPFSPMDDIDRYLKMSDDKFVIYDKYSTKTSK